MPRDERLRGAFLALLVAAFGLLALAILRPFTSYLLAALLLAFLLRPAQVRLAPRVGPRVAAVALVAGSVGATAVALALLVRALPADAARVSAAAERALGGSRLDRQLEALLGTGVPVEAALANAPRRLAELLVGDLGSLVRTATHAFLGVVLLLFVLYYLLVDGERLVAWVVRSVPLRRETTERLADEASRTTWAVLKGHVLVAVIQGAVAGVGLVVVGLPHVVFWSAVMMVLELFPVVGVAGVLGPATLYLALEGRLLAAGFLFAYGLTAVAAVDDYVRALLVERDSSLHSAVVLVGVFGGVYVFGAMGLFFGPIVLGLFGALVAVARERYSDLA